MRLTAANASFDTARNLELTARDFQQAIQRLASGLRINSASDDPAGAAVAAGLQSQTGGFNQAERNSQDAVSMLQTASSALVGTAAFLERIRVLAVQAASDTYTDADRAAMQSEVNSLLAEIDRVSRTTSFNSRTLLDGSSSATVQATGPDLAFAAAVQATVAGTYTITGAQNATRSVFESNGSPNGSAFTQQSSITIQGGLGTATFDEAPGTSLQDFFREVDQAGIGVTAAIDTVNFPGNVILVNSNYGTVDPILNPSGPQQVVA
ncbi:MAG: hypothetical protein JOZ39_12985, partial [Chloroflexi bacterium]|nr:hypothetical protein [Chloroflexota bacterium]